MLQTEEDHLSQICALIYNEGDAGGLAIINPNLCVVGVYGDESCEGELIAYSMHWDGEPSCFNLTGSPGWYYASVSCIAPTQSTSQITTLTINAELIVSVS
jgi:hypothetical protein